MFGLICYYEVLGFDDIDVLNQLGIPLSVVDRSEKEMGRKAMEILLRHMRKTDTKSAHVSVPTQLILRGSEKAGSVRPDSKKRAGKKNGVGA